MVQNKYIISAMFNMHRPLLVVCAVWGVPNELVICSAFPWSAVTNNVNLRMVSDVTSSKWHIIMEQFKINRTGIIYSMRYIIINRIHYYDERLLGDGFKTFDFI